jgi:hypothetical protein
MKYQERCGEMPDESGPGSMARRMRQVKAGREGMEMNVLTMRLKMVRGGPADA